MAAKSLWKEEMSYGGDTWYMGRIHEELKKMIIWFLSCVWFCADFLVENLNILENHFLIIAIILPWHQITFEGAPHQITKHFVLGL